MSSRAVCYIATTGHLFQTVLSATQARKHVAQDVRVVVCHIADEPSDAQRQFRAICDLTGIEFLTVPSDVFDGRPAVFARLFLDRMLPADIDQILYLDGDTQIIAGIDQLVAATPPEYGAIAVRDPMVLARSVSRKLRGTIDSWWDQSQIPDAVRPNYFNAGVLRLTRSTLPYIRKQIWPDCAASTAGYRFADQDALNVALRGSVDIVSMSWNFPGFLLGTQLAEQSPPRIVHFMSDPRPWNAPLHPWGVAYHEPYQRFARTYPGVAPYWDRATPIMRLQYTLQQFVKRSTERRSWQSVEASQMLRVLEGDLRILTQ